MVRLLLFLFSLLLTVYYSNKGLATISPPVLRETIQLGTNAFSCLIKQSNKATYLTYRGKAASLLLIRAAELTLQASLPTDTTALLNAIASQKPDNYMLHMTYAAIVKAPETITAELKKNDRLILASDQVWKIATVEELATWIEGKNDTEASQAILSEVKKRVAGRSLVADELNVIVYDYR